MSTDDAELQLQILSERQRRCPIVLPQESTDEELLRDFSLSEADRAEIGRCRGPDNQIGFALQLCVLRQHGRFLTDFSDLPTRIVNHLAKQLELPPLLFLRYPEREATDLTHRSTAISELASFHHGLPCAGVWGEGEHSSSDGQRFGVRASTSLSSFYPRYFGYYDRVFTIYTHVSDQHSVFGTKAISCSVREALCVLDGLLENDTVLAPRERSTDTHGYTEHIFALCHLLGFSFLPRIRALGDQRLYRLSRDADDGRLNGILRGTVDLALVRESNGTRSYASSLRCEDA